MVPGSWKRSTGLWLLGRNAEVWCRSCSTFVVCCRHLTKSDVPLVSVQTQYSLISHQTKDTNELQQLARIFGVADDCV